MTPAIGQSELMKRAALNAGRFRKPNLQKELRESILSSNRPADQSESEEEQESIHKTRLGLLKAGAIKQANQQAGALAGEVAGGALGSAVPILGTGAGAFIGRLIGKKLGVTGIIITAILVNLFILLMFFVVLKYGCNKTHGVQWLIGVKDLCLALGE
jgi:hypothetical protein